MAMEKKLSEHLPLSTFPQNRSDDDKTIVKMLNNLPIVTVGDKNYVDVSSINNASKNFNQRTNRYWNNYHKNKCEIEILRQKVQHQEEKFSLNDQIIDLSNYGIKYQDKIRKETFFHRYPTITWGFGVSFGIAISFGLFKLCNWFQ
jgi:hypothetical protein